MRKKKTTIYFRSRLELPLLWNAVLLGVVLALMANSLVAQPPAELAPSKVKSIDFLTDVLPILDQHCSNCHGASKQTADLRLDLRSAILKGSNSGPVVEKGHSEQSRLIQVVAGLDPDYQMPPEGDRLSP
jgi:hypothetical protein